MICRVLIWHEVGGEIDRRLQPPEIATSSMFVRGRTVVSALWLTDPDDDSWYAEDMRLALANACKTNKAKQYACKLGPDNVPFIVEVI